MAYSNGIITAPVSINDVQRALGNGSCDLGTLCQSVSINQWSKYKPVGKAKISTIDELSSDRKTWLASATWWKGNGTTIDVPSGTVIGSYTLRSAARWFIKCGVKILGFSSQVDVLGAFNPAGNPCTEQNIGSSLLKDNYSYIPPAGGASEPFRLTDFNQYKHDASFIIIPGYETATGVERVLLKQGSTNAVYKYSELWTYQTSDGTATELDIDDLFSSVNFVVVCGVLDGNNLTYVAIDQEDTSYTNNQYRQRRLNLNVLNSSTYYNKTIIGIYCILVDGYYIPVMQANYYHPNTQIVYRQENLRCYKAWHIEKTTDPLPDEMSVAQKQSYGTSNAFLDIATNRSWTFTTTPTAMDRWYLKINMPKESSSYTVTTYGLKIEFLGMFVDLNNRQQYATHIVEQSADVRFVVKNQEPNSMEWGDSDSIQIASGTGTQTIYLAIYELFAELKKQYKSGTIWRMKFMHGNYSSDGSFTSVREATYGNPTGSGTDALSVSF